MSVPEPKLAVIIPAYNAARWLPLSVGTVVEQSYRNLEVIVVDDESKDDTEACVRELSAKDPRILYRKQKNQGCAASRNTGLKEISADVEFVMFLDADDELEPGILAALVAGFAADPSSVAIYGSVRYIGPDGQPVRAGEAEYWTAARRRLSGSTSVACTPTEPSTFEVMVINHCIFSAGQVLLRRAVVESMNGFESRLRAVEDWHMWIRVTSRGHHFRYVDVPALRYRRHSETQLSSNFAHMEASRAQMHAFLEEELTPEKVQILRRGRRERKRLASLVWLGWAGVAARKGKLLTAANQVRHAVQDYAKYLIDPA